METKFCQNAHRPCFEFDLSIIYAGVWANATDEQLVYVEKGLIKLIQFLTGIFLSFLLSPTHFVQPTLSHPLHP
jgi:hypothetical protein